MASALSEQWGLRPVPDGLRDAYVADGFWTDQSLGEMIASAVTERPDLRFKVRSDVRPWDGTVGEVMSQARRLAGGLRKRGIGPGDVVSLWLPNWTEAAVSFWAAAMLGCVVTPIVHFYGAKEVAYILRRTGVRAIITADRFGRMEFLEILDGLQADAPALELAAIVRSAGDPSALPGWATAFTDLLDDSMPVDGPVRVDPSAPALVGYTSGTTADPKGVVHSHRSIGFEVRQLGSMQSGNPPLLVGAPVGHAIGMLSGLLVPVWKRDPIHLIDVWDPAAVLRTMLEDGVAAGSGSTYFLTSLLDHPDFGPKHLALMSRIGLGGSPVPVAVTERMTSLGISPVRSYGSTEHPSSTGARHDEPLDKRCRTDGHPLLGVELKLVDEDGREVPIGTPGEILSRGPDLCIGYTDPALTGDSFDHDGWFVTGDIGVLDEDGWLAIVDRKKDVIIRGGENVSALEIEEELLRMPGVAEAAVVAAPDERLGEHACAFLRLMPGVAAPGLEDVRARMAEAGMAKQKWPEEIRTVDELPRTASGKVQKYVLRDALRRGE